MAQGNLVLTPQHLSLIRASLRFWRDEMVGCNTAIIAAYFDSPKEASLPHTQLAGELIQLLERCSVGYAIYESGELEIIEQKLLGLLHEDGQLLDSGQRLVTVLGHL